MGVFALNMSQALSAFRRLSDSYNYDQQIYYHGGAPTPLRGYFSPACFIHTSFDPSGPLISGTSYIKAIGEWLSDRRRDVFFADHCPPGSEHSVFCNPTCGMSR